MNELVNPLEIEEQKRQLYKEVAEWPPGGKYSLEQKLEATTQYFLTGNMKETARKTGIPETTIIDWKNKSPWWQSLTEQYRAENTARFDATCTKIIEKAQNAILDRLNNGDEHVLSNGDKVKKAVNIKDLTVVMGINFDKQRIVRNLPTSIKADSGNVLNSMVNKLMDLEQKLKEKTVSGETIDNEPE